MEEVFQTPQVAAGRGSETMLAPQEVQRMLALSAQGTVHANTRAGPLHLPGVSCAKHSMNSRHEDDKGGLRRSGESATDPYGTH